MRQYLNRSLAPRGLLSPLFAALIVLCLAALPAAAQIGNLTDSTSTPLPGRAHDYLGAKLPSDTRVFGGAVMEYVNPGSGSVSWRICATLPKGRQLTMPFCFDYDSEGVHHIESNAPGALAWNSDTSHLAQGGWAYGLPELSEVTRQDVSGGYKCDYATGYMFQNPSGERHAMYLAITGPAPGAPTNSCSMTSPSRQTVTTAGEGPILATTTAPSGSFTVTAATITDADGTRYIFNEPAKEAGVNNFAAELPDVIEDRNGNEITVTDSGGGNFSLADTVGRTLLASSGFGASGNTVQVSGESEPYTVDWGAATSDFTVTANVESGTCSVPTTVSGSQPVISSITLPDGEAFQFAYDPTYGLLQKITFPTGGYIRYVWGLNGQGEEGTFDGASGTCSVRYDQPVLTDRYVSLDGSTEILHQHFAYSTAWGSGSGWSTKQTTLTNSDLLRNTSFETVYTYSGYGVPLQPNDDTASTLQIPVEQNIVYNDWTGAMLRTVAETWQNPRLLLSKTITENNGQVSEQTFTYDQNEQQIQKDEYAYGNGAVGGLTRVTVYAYGCASGPHVVDRPTAIKIEDQNQNVAAETEYFYDQSALAPSGATDGRDPAYAAGGGITARCNLTTLTKINQPNNINETYTYDDAGNPLAHTDGNGNTAAYAYGSTYQAAYVTQTTLPNTTTGGRPVAHSQTMTYDPASGQIASLTDVQNQTTTNWTYDDPLSRLTEVDYPDGGQTLYIFAPTNVETERQQHSNCNCYMHAFEDWDGLGRVIRSTAYNGSYWQTVDTAFDGEDQPIYQSYPYFNSSASSPQASSNSDQPGDTSTFDALGRVTLVVHSDNSQVSTSYSGPDTTRVDEVGNKTMDIADALGRLVEVAEYYNPTSYYSTYYGYGLLDELVSVSQGSETRSYTFDNINRMLSAVNPESGTTTYLRQRQQFDSKAGGERHHHHLQLRPTQSPSRPELFRHQPDRGHAQRAN